MSAELAALNPGIWLPHTGGPLGPWVVAPITAAALTAIPERQAGIAVGVNATSSRLGSLAATAVLGLVVSLVLAARTDKPNLVPLTLGQDGHDFIPAQQLVSARR